jgi:serine/threonine protein kinase
MPLTKLGRYNIKGLIGNGRMGRVYLAEDPVLHRPLTIKTFHLGDYSRNDPRNFSARFAQEATAIARLDHKGIVTIYDVGQQDDVAYIAMEYIDEQSLEAVIASSEYLSNPEVFRILSEIAGALDYVHSKGIVHRDIKPSNILIDREGHAKVADFGIAKVENLVKTLQGVLMGTPIYMAPEQITEGPVDGGVDEWALATVAYEMLTKRKLFQADNIASAAHRIVNLDPLTKDHGLPSEVQAVFERALQRSPENRFSNCSEFTKTLCAALQRKEQTTGFAPGANPTRGTSGRIELSVASSGKQPFENGKGRLDGGLSFRIYSGPDRDRTGDLLTASRPRVKMLWAFLLYEIGLKPKPVLCFERL